MKYVWIIISLITVFCNPASAQLSFGLIGKWTFDGDVDDYSGNGNHATVHNNVYGTKGYDGIANHAMFFDGDSAYLTIPYNPDFSPEEYSICALVQPYRFYDKTCQANYLFAKGPASDIGHYGLAFSDNGYDNDCNVFSKQNENFIVASTQAATAWNDPANYLKEYDWYCVVASYKADTVRLFIKGKLVKKFYDPVMNTNGPGVISIGRNLSEIFPYYFSGKIDELRLYNYAMEEAMADAFCQQVTNGVPAGTATTQRQIEVLVYPNPAEEKLNVFLPPDYAGHDGHIINNLGIIVKQIPNMPTGKNVIDLEQIPAGVYFLKITNGNNAAVRKFIRL